MEFETLAVAGAFVITLRPHYDDRGYFVRTYDEPAFANHGLQTQWVQENQSRSVRALTVRGLHFQHAPFAETKVVRVVRGAIFDVCVDLRESSPSFGQWVGVELSEVNHRVLYIPKGCAHGFCTLCDDVVVTYKVDAPYAPEFEGGVRWDDPTLAISWPVSGEEVVLSEKDRHLPLWRSVVH